MPPDNAMIAAHQTESMTTTAARTGTGGTRPLRTIGHGHGALGDHEGRTEDERTDQPRARRRAEGQAHTDDDELHEQDERRREEQPVGALHGGRLTHDERAESLLGDGGGGTRS